MNDTCFEMGLDHDGDDGDRVLREGLAFLPDIASEEVVLPTHRESERVCVCV